MTFVLSSKHMIPLGMGMSLFKVGCACQQQQPSHCRLCYHAGASSASQQSSTLRASLEEELEAAGPTPSPPVDVPGGGFRQAAEAGQLPYFAKDKQQQYTRLVSALQCPWFLYVDPYSQPCCSIRVVQYGKPLLQVVPEHQAVSCMDDQQHTQTCVLFVLQQHFHSVYGRGLYCSYMP